jgi:hypothetical protein
MTKQLLPMAIATTTLLAALLAKTAPLAATGQYEQFRTRASFNGTAHHPEWLG